MSRDALVVGVNTYQYLPSLKAPARDAEAVAQQLHTYGEFRVHRLPEVIQSGRPLVGQKTQVTLRELETALINLFKPKGSAIPQTAVFYFSGHGIQRDAGIREGYLALSDSNPDQGFYGLSLFWLRRLLQESPVRQRIIWLDCCHSGELLNFLEADPGAHPGTDRLFMAASREYETAYESLDSQYSVFTNALLTGLDPTRVTSGVVTNHSLTDWVNHTLKGEIQQPLFESSGSEIILTRQQVEQAGRSSSPSTIQSKEICPYRGLEFFDEFHADYFFGREDLTAQLIKHLTEHHFVAIAGASGSGKSSLVRAGLIAQLRQGKKASGSDHWKIKLMTPAEHPLKSLAGAFIDPELSDLERAEQLRRAETFLQDGGAGLAQLVRASLPTNLTSLSPEQRPRFVLVVDQFEEVFTLSQGSQAERERQEFFDCLIGALEHARDLLSIVIVLRADFFNKCSLYEGLAQQITQHQIIVPPLKYEQIKATIVRPAQKVGLVCEPNLVYTMLLDVIGAPGELPLLQYTLLELWRRRRVGAEGGVARLTLDAYQELGGVRGTLQKRATEVFHSLTSEEQGVARRIFLALTQLGEGTEDTRRRVVKSELVSPAFPMQLVEQVLEKLVAAKLIITSQENRHTEDLKMEETCSQNLSGSGFSPTLTGQSAAVTPLSVVLEKNCSQEIVDVTHEALIRNWSLLRGWLDESREMLRRQRRIEQAAHEWDQAGQPITGEFLLNGLRLRDAEDFLRLHPQELSALAQQYVHVSCTECRRARRESRQLQIAIPSVLMAALTIVLSQYYGAIRSQTDKDAQLQKATARERAAIAQTVLQDSSADPMTALLISRLAAEGEDAGYEAQASLRAALQNLRLQSQLKGHEGSVRHIVFSPDQKYLGTAGNDGTIHLWAIHPKTVYNTGLKAEKVLAWSASSPTTQTPTRIQSIVFSANGQQIAAVAENSATVKIWSVESGVVVHELNGSALVKHIGFSPDGTWFTAVTADQKIFLWDSHTGTLKAILPQNSAINDLQVSPDGKFLLSAGEDGIAQLWQLAVDTTGATKLDSIKTFIHPEVVYQAIFSPSGRWIATRCKDGKVRLWDSQTGQLQQSLPTAAKGVASPKPAEQDSTGALKITFPPMKQMEFSPDEQTLATIDSNQRVWFWNTQSGQLQLKLDNDHARNRASRRVSTSEPKLLKFSPNSRIFVTTTSTVTAKTGFYSAYLWNRQTGEQIGELSGHRKPITSVQFSLDGTYVVTASADGMVRLWATELGGELPSIQLANNPVEWATFLPSRRIKNEGAVGNTALPSSTQDGLGAAASASSITEAVQPGSFDQADWWSSVQNRVAHWQPWRHALNQQPDRSYAGQILTVNPTDQTGISGPTAGNPTSEVAVANMATISADGTLQQWKILTDTPVQPSNIQLPFAGSTTAALQPPDGSTNLREKLMTLIQQAWSLGHSELQPIEPEFSQLAQTPALKNVFASLPLTPSLANLDLPNTNAVFSSFAMSANGLLLATADLEGWITIYQMQPDQSLRILHRVRNWRSADSRTDTTTDLLSEVAGSPSSLVNSPNRQGTPSEHPNIPVAIRHLAFSPDGRQLLGAADDLTMRSWDTQSGQQLAVLRGHTATIRQAHYSADGQWIISASWDRTARIWQSATGRLVKILPHEDAVSSASFSPNGQRVVTTSWNGTAQIWKVSTGKSLFVLNKHQQAVLDAQFSPDGRLLVTASTDGTARLWNTATGEDQALLRPHQGGDQPESILQAFFSPDGQYVATLTKGGQVNLWAATQDMLLQTARERTQRQLTPEECSHYLRLSPDQCPKLDF